MGKGYRKFKRGVGTAYKVASKALDLAIKTKKLLNVEYKIIDTADQGFFNPLGIVIPINLCGQGTGAQARTGVSVKTISNQYRMFVTASAANTTNDQVYRVIMFRDRNNQGVAPLVTDVLESAFVNAPLNNNNKTRFEVLHDKIDYVGTNSKQSSIWKIFKREKGNSHAYYEGSNNTIAELLRGGVFLLLIGEAAMNQPHYEFISRFKFIDN